jgi:hypothetical protein
VHWFQICKPDSAISSTRPRGLVLIFILFSRSANGIQVHGFRDATPLCAVVSRERSRVRITRIVVIYIIIPAQSVYYAHAADSARLGATAAKILNNKWAPVILDPIAKLCITIIRSVVCPARACTTIQGSLRAIPQCSIGFERTDDVLHGHRCNGPKCYGNCCAEVVTTIYHGQILQ